MKFSKSAVTAMLVAGGLATAIPATTIPAFAQCGGKAKAACKASKCNPCKAKAKKAGCGACAGKKK